MKFKSFITVLTVFIVTIVLSFGAIMVFATPIDTKTGIGDIKFRSDTQIIPPPTFVPPTDPTDPTPTPPWPTPEPTPPGWDIGLKGHDISFGSRLLGANYTFRSTDNVGVATLDPIAPGSTIGIPDHLKHIDIVVYNMSVSPPAPSPQGLHLTASRTEFNDGSTNLPVNFYLHLDKFQEYEIGQNNVVDETASKSKPVTGGSNGIEILVASATNMIEEIPDLSWVGGRWSGVLDVNNWTGIRSLQYTTTITWNIESGPK